MQCSPDIISCKVKEDLEGKLTSIMLDIQEIKVKVTTLTERGSKIEEKRIRCLSKEFDDKLEKSKTEMKGEIETVSRHVKTVGALSFSIGFVTAFFLRFFSK